MYVGMLACLYVCIRMSVFLGASVWRNCASRPPLRRRARSRRCRRCGRWGRAARRWMRRRRCWSSAAPSPARAWLARASDRRVVNRSRPARLVRRDVSNTELAALPAAADWPSLVYL